MLEHASLPRAEDLVGTFRRFGPFGPVYEVLTLRRDAAGDVVFRVRLPETLEELELPYASLVCDPEAD